MQWFSTPATLACQGVARRAKTGVAGEPVGEFEDEDDDDEDE
jgi:hypothetical protein